MTSHKRLLLGTGAALLAMVGASACAGGSSGGGGDTAGVSSKEIKIASTVASSGNFAVVTGPFINAANAYFDTINKDGGVNGREISWSHVDDGYDLQRAVAGAQKVVQQDSAFIAALPFGTATTLATAKVYSARKVPNVTLGTALAETEGDNAATTFGCTTPYHFQTRAAIKWAAENMPKGSWASLVYESADGEDVSTALQAQAEEDGLDIAKEIKYAPGTTDFSGPLDTLKRAGVKYVVLFGSTPDAARVVTAAKSAGLDTTFVGPMPLADPDFLTLTKGKAEGTIAASPYKSLTSDEPGIADFKELLSTSGGADAKPTLWALHGYNCATIIAEGLKKAGKNPTRTSFVKGMETIKDFDNGVSAPVSFSADDHRASTSSVVLRVSGDTYEQESADWISFDE